MSSYSRYLTRLSARRAPSITREMTRILADASDNMITLATGFPNPNTFPVNNIKFGLRDGTELTVDSALAQKALQYQPTNGLPELLRHLKHMQERFHCVDFSKDDVDLAVLTGGQDGLCKSLEMLLEPNDPIVVEKFIYSGTLAILAPYQPEYRVVDSDCEGMQPESLQKVLENQGKHGKKAKILYVVPTGSNPTGSMLSLERRKGIYDLCCRHDLLILEDDPYFFMRFDEHQQNHLPSFLSMDKERRVIRFDSFSKVLSSGIRLGFVTGPKELVQRITLHMQVSVLHAPALSQVMVYSILDAWGDSGLDRHIAEVSQFYAKKRDLMCESAQKHLGDLCEFEIPKAGMFLWMRVRDFEDTWELIMKRGLQEDIMLIPGKCFMCSDEKSPKSPFLRASYSCVPDKDIDVAMQRLAKVIREEKRKNHH